MTDDKKRISRRSVLRGGVTLVPAAAIARGALGVSDTAPRAEAAPVRRRRRRQGPRVVVIGAGAFGGWTALHLQRSGARVTLCDTWGPGHSRASSGGESRVIRHTYADRIYVDWVIRALELWRENQARWDRPLFHPVGVLWMVPTDDGFETTALEHVRSVGVAHERLGADEFARRYPQINAEGVRWAIWEPTAGYLLARRGCEAVAEAFIEEGGEYRQVACTMIDAEGGEMRGVGLSDDSAVSADAYVFACGPWLGKVFRELMGPLITPTRQEVYYFGTPGGVTDYDEGDLPVWADSAGRFWYGIPGAERRGFKMADDEHGTVVDPTTQERELSDAGIARARAYLEHRFPGMRGAPLIEGRVCQYENSPDGHFIIDRHPLAANAWIVGGGSGHGYKHGPALGEYVAGLVLDDGTTEPMFSLARFA
ncbi:MAG: FAD-dependent oxidoreductase [Acidobacteriota bacterium]|jgi:glycine/D-amino acid oxidase-like deaminating enzyme